MYPCDPSSDHTAHLPRPLRVATLPLSPLPSPSPNRSSPHGTISPNSSQSSLYLSPPLTDSELEEVPYKASAGDRISLDMHNTRKRRRKSRCKQKPQSLAVVGRDRPPNQLWPIKEFHESRPQRKPLVLRGNFNGDSGSPEIESIRSRLLKAPQNEGSISVRSKSGPRDTLQKSNPTRKRASTMRRAQRRNGDKGSTEIPKKRRRWTLLGDGLPPSTSLAIVHAGCHSEDKVAILARIRSNETARPPPPTKKNSTWIIRALRDGSRRRKSSHGQKYDTPATITLRKASKIYQCEKVSPEHNGPTPQVHHSLVTAQPTLESGFSDSKESGNRPATNRVASAISNISGDAPVPTTITLATIGREPQDRAWIRRPTITAETALTFAEVHTSPKVFLSGGASSRKHSLLVQDTIRRSSVVQIRSGGSVHEIIWDKNDTPSTGSWNSRDTMSPDVLSTTARNDLDGKVATRSAWQHGLQSGGQSESDHFQDPTIEAKLFGTSDEPQAAEKILCWSWGKADAGSTPDAPFGAAEADEPVPAPVPSSSRDKARKRNQSLIISPIIGVESFPPLLNRNSTYEWIRAPFVDLKDPMAGRDGTAPVDNPLSQSTPDDTKAEARTRKTTQAELNSISKSRKSSRVGEAIGTSQGHRRPSAGPTQQRPYKSLLDVSKSVSRKASVISQSLTDLVLGSRAGGAGFAKLPGEDPLGDGPPDPVIWGAEGLAVVPQWGRNNSSGLRINTMVSQPMPRLIEGVGSYSEEAD